MKGELKIRKVASLVEKFSQVTSAVGDDSGNLWSGIRYNASNGWYVNTSNGNVNNNNTINRYYVVPVPSVEFLFSLLLRAEELCYINKHSSLTAARVHYHLSELYAYTLHIYQQGLSVGRSKCFVLDYPVYREIFCAQYYDRIIHHLVAPLMVKVAEREHMKNGDISHGNRIGHSAYTAALSIQKKLYKITSGWKKGAWLAKLDYSGFFMSISRQKAAEIFRSLSSNESFLTDIVCLYLTADPTQNCIRLSPDSAWSKVAPNKSLFSAKEGYGLPIGNFPSQLMANLYRTGVDDEINRINGVEQVVFVDDRVICAEDKNTLKDALKIAESVSEKYGLVTSKTKRYFQRANKGVKFCGFVVKCDRIYISNRVVSACSYMVNTYKDHKDPKAESELAKRINSYFGLMCHTCSFNIQKRIASQVLKEHNTLYFVIKKNQFVCKQKIQHTPYFASLQLIKLFKKYDKILFCRRVGHHRKRWSAYCGMAQK